MSSVFRRCAIRVSDLAVDVEAAHTTVAGSMYPRLAVERRVTVDTWGGFVRGVLIDRWLAVERLRRPLGGAAREVRLEYRYPSQGGSRVQIPSPPLEQADSRIAMRDSACPPATSSALLGEIRLVGSELLRAGGVWRAAEVSGERRPRTPPPSRPTRSACAADQRQDREAAADLLMSRTARPITPARRRHPSSTPTPVRQAPERQDVTRRGSPDWDGSPRSPC